MAGSASSCAAPRYDGVIRFVHLFLVSLCLAGWGSAQFAGDYKYAEHLGFDVHRWIGVGFAAALLLRVLYGLLGPHAVRFANWFPFSASNLKLAEQDIAQLSRLQVTERAPHEGIAGLVQGLGVIAFIAIASTGVAMALYLEPGSRASGWLHAVKQIHEAAQLLIPAYLLLHLGGVVLHALFGQDLWRSMFFLRPRRSE